MPLQTAMIGAITAAVPRGTPVTTGVTTSELSPDETRALLARLEPLPALGDQSAAPPVRAPSAPPPRSSSVQPIAFVTPQGKAVTHAPIAPRDVVAPLVPPQISPEGAIAQDSEVRIRFDEPMVPVARVGAIATPPATIVPAIAGSWRWLDTRVLQFTVSRGAFPGATAYTVTVPAGTRAVSGATLRAPQVTRFETPPISLAGVWPRRVRPDSPLVVQLDQPFDADAIAPLLRVLDARQRPLAWKRVDLATARAAWRKNPSLAVDDRVLAKPHLLIAPVTTWPPASEPQLQLRPNAPSREGPLRSTRDSFRTFEVVGPMRLVGIQCGDMVPRRHGARCPAEDLVWVEMSNEIDERSYRSSKIQIAGQPLEDHRPSGTSVYLTAPEKVGATYALTIGDGIMDRYGQPLVGPRDASFRTLPGRVESTLYASSEGLTVLDPRFTTPQWRVMGQAIVALRVQLYRVQPSDYFAYEDFEAGRRASPPGALVLDKSYPVGARYHAQLDVDLRPALARSGLGHVVAVAFATPAAPATGRAQRLSSWLQVTKLGLDARMDREQLGAYVVDISPSQVLSPVAGASVGLVLENRAAPPAQATNAEGIATLPLLAPGTFFRVPRALVQARTNSDSTFVAIDAFTRAVRRQRVLWYVTDDRFTYKPGEHVHVKGWIRMTHDGANPGLAPPAASQRIAYRVEDARGNKLAAGTAGFTAHGGFDLDIALPPNANLGTAYISLSTEHGSYRHPIAIQEFRTPAFAVDLNDDVSHAGATPLVVGESLEMSVAARYYAGGGLGGAQVDWRAQLTESTYRPPGWDGFAFTPVRANSDSRASVDAAQSGTLSGASTANVVWGIAALPGRQPSILEVDATVTDVDRASIRASSRPIVVHPSRYYVGLRLLRDDTLQTIVTDIDGEPVRGVPVEIAIHGVLPSETHRADAIVQSRQHCRPTSGDAPVACAWKRDRTLVYSAIATVKDARGRANTTRYSFPRWFWNDAKQTGFRVTADSTLYRVGDIAKLTIHSDVVPATALVTFARNGIVGQRRVALAQPATAVELPIEPSFIQNVHVVVDRLASAPTTLLPTRDSRELELLVDRESARLAMRVRAIAPLVEPGAKATFEVEVAHGDRPQAGAEVALMVVDEAVLSLSAKQFADPLEPFYRRYNSRTSTASSISLVEDAGDRLQASPGFEKTDLAHFGFGRSGFGPGGGGTGWGTIGTGRYGTIGHGSGTGIVAARKDFRATAVFSPKLVTGPDGKTRIEVQMPDSLTRFRIVALATAETHRFGKAESTIVTQRKLNARTVAPRFLTQGDAFSLPVVVQNLDRAPRTIDVAVRAANLRSTGPAGKRVTIPGGQRAEVRFDFATQTRGKAVVQTIVASNHFADATTVELPVHEPATTESFATYGIVDGSAPRFEQLAVPASIFPEVGGVEVELASTQLASLTDAFYYVHSYPYECAEQRSSRMIASAALGDILVAFGSRTRPSRQLLDDTRARDVRAFGKTQLADGGWGYFGGMAADPFVTMQVLTALAMQKATGPVVRKATAYVEKQAATLLARLEAAVAKSPAERTDRDQFPYVVGLAATALTALAVTGVDMTVRAQRLHALATTLEAYPIDAKARLLSLVARLDRAKAMRETLLAALVHATHQTAASATVTASYVPAERLLLVSSTRTTALALDAIMRERPEHPLVPKLARGVLDGRKHGRWTSTQENLVALQTMRRYFDTYEKATPKFAGKLWFGSAAYAEQAFEGRGTTSALAALGWPALGAGTSHDVALVKEGVGRMYYRIGITYAPKQVDLPPLDAGFVVRRSYTALEEPGDVVQTADGYRIELGAKVLVTIETLNTTRRFNVAVVDPLPAGFESVNESLANAERAAKVSNNEWDHMALRDNRSEAFAMDMREGSHRFSYTVRATTPGTFVAAPAKAEEMYSPETFGRSSGLRVVVE